MIEIINNTINLEKPTYKRRLMAISKFVYKQED